MMNISSSKGFSIVETVVAVTVLGVILTMMSPIQSNISQLRAAEEEARNHNELIAIKDAHLEFASTNNNGVLSAPYTSGSCYKCAIDLTNTELVAYVENNLDRSAELANLSVIGNKVRGLMIAPTSVQTTVNLPFAANIVVEYQQGAVVQTDCSAGASCDTGSTWETPQYSASGWVPNDLIRDFIPFNTLKTQDLKVKLTINQVRELQIKFRDYFQSAQIANPSVTDTNWHPKPNLPSTPDMSNQPPLSNAGCIHGWHNLADPDVNVLAMLSTNSEEGVTPFGGSIEYCADYNLLATDASEADTFPHDAALRINRFVTKGIPPSSTNDDDNLIFPI